MKINIAHLENIVQEETHKLLKEFTNEPDPGKRDEACADDDLLKEAHGVDPTIKVDTLYGQYEWDKKSGRKAGWWWCSMTLYIGDAEQLHAVASAKHKPFAGLKALRRLAQKMVKAPAEGLATALVPEKSQHPQGTSPLVKPKSKNVP